MIGFRIIFRIRRFFDDVIENYSCNFFVFILFLYLVKRKVKSAIIRNMKYNLSKKMSRVDE